MIRMFIGMGWIHGGHAPNEAINAFKIQIQKVAGDTSILKCHPRDTTHGSGNGI